MVSEVYSPNEHTTEKSKKKKKYPRVVQWNSSISEQSFLRLCELVTCMAGASTDSKGGSSNMTETGPL